MIPDYHVHTLYSDDSEYPMEQVVLDAIGLGLTELCFTDHVDYGVKRDWDDPRGMLYRSGGASEPEKIPLANIDHPRLCAGGLVCTACSNDSFCGTKPLHSHI